MSRKCEATGKGSQYGNRVSKSNAKTRHRFKPNLQTKKFWSQEQNKFISLKISTSAIRSIDKLGFDAFVRKNNIKV